MDFSKAPSERCQGLVGNYEIYQLSLTPLTVTERHGHKDRVKNDVQKEAVDKPMVAATDCGDTQEKAFKVDFARNLASRIRLPISVSKIGETPRQFL
ncbi:hypothetical protein FANTH_7792 [Fusarium anthophilum]|uniref:Uncharacterized protein n=1 Tax=Fusarium anthophilum TaxID=48485 RepID=A0A8H5E2G8_9HYPO|nr:hypothetical protein FANTH_7792 [Fusarium anthophilum]